MKESQGGVREFAVTPFSVAMHERRNSETGAIDHCEVVEARHVEEWSFGKLKFDNDLGRVQRLSDVACAVWRCSQLNTPLGAPYPLRLRKPCRRFVLRLYSTLFSPVKSGQTCRP